MTYSEQIKNAYETLGLELGATEAQVNSAHKEIAKKYHPDLHMNDTPDEIAHLNELLAQANTARKILLDYIEIEAAKAQVTPEEAEKAATISLMYVAKKEIPTLESFIKQSRKIDRYFSNNKYANNQAEIEEYIKNTEAYINVQDAFLEKISDKKGIGFNTYKSKLDDLKTMFNSIKKSQEITRETAEISIKAGKTIALMNSYVKSGFNNQMVPKLNALIDENKNYIAEKRSSWEEINKKDQAYSKYYRFKGIRDKLTAANDMLNDLVKAKPAIKEVFATVYNKDFYEEIGLSKNYQILHETLPAIINKICERTDEILRNEANSTTSDIILKGRFLDSIKDFYDYVDNATTGKLPTIEMSPEIKDFKKALGTYAIFTYLYDSTESFMFDKVLNNPDKIDEFLYYDIAKGAAYKKSNSLNNWFELAPFARVAKTRLLPKPELEKWINILPAEYNHSQVVQQVNEVKELMKTYQPIKRDKYGLKTHKFILGNRIDTYALEGVSFATGKITKDDYIIENGVDVIKNKCDLYAIRLILSDDEGILDDIQKFADSANDFFKKIKPLVLETHFRPSRMPTTIKGYVSDLIEFKNSIDQLTTQEQAEVMLTKLFDDDPLYSDFHGMVETSEELFGRTATKQTLIAMTRLGSEQVKKMAEPFLQGRYNCNTEKLPEITYSKRLTPKPPPSRYTIPNYYLR
ncbi:MAG: DnaJ domain-containing protein [Clostridiales bacterium]|jgi:hypothetical protein|nr:DnaJ domain-containing protein [Clostridiales bacterium]